MSPEVAISAENVWKRFRADRRRMLLRDEVDRIRRIRRGEAESGHRWVLRDVNVRIEPGESVGFVGVNGSGKSTLLKLFSRVMYPYAGRVTANGRVGALIEVRAGIHPDLSGRENVFLYGSLLGLRRKDVAARFDEIVAFAEVAEAIDRQVKFYSSGMQMRLGFAVAAFLDPEVLLVDEVLAVGDASFQQKCLNRMRQVLADGTTLVFVSHDLAAVEATCSRALWLDSGVVRKDGPVRDVVDAYRSSIEEAAELDSVVDGPVRLVKAQVSGPNGRAPRSSEQMVAKLVLDCPFPTPANVFLGISHGPATPIFVQRRDLNLATGETAITCAMEHVPLPRGRYFLWLGVFDRKRDLVPWHPVARFDVSGPDLQEPPRAIVRLAPLHVEAAWEVSRL
jgi:ABC-2 type transport system ATP-binding protein